MNNSLDTSFIPQQPLLKVEGYSQRQEPVNIVLVLAFVIFFSTLAIAVGMYFYKTSLVRGVVALEKQLESKESILKTDDIERFKAIDTRLAVVKQLLENHSAFSTILTLLEKITAQDVGLTALSYGVDSTDGSIELTLGGQAPSYSAVYAQVEAWRGMSSILKDVKVGTPTLSSESSVVTFDANLTIDPAYVKYARALKDGNSAQTTPEIETPAASDSPATDIRTTP
jgi:hypothetical protein